ncbi:phage GP46 family protein [Burkholderia anthina]|uniref:phage GP46 family protein n=1 Tax=Burkholderia anthina TaxID=179879 RepID=UPI00158CA25C
MDALLDPTTRDYAGTSTSTLQTAVYIRLATPLGFYWAAPDVGSKLYTLQREKDTPRVRGLAVQYCEQALEPLLKQGRATSITVTPMVGDPGWLVLLITIVDAAGRTQHFKHPVKVS